ncbi:hypothetical protein [Ectothiorhodospira lacustris]|uniref:hypothetical protein n=1 Tax=Ectothiorhodospira lacustris TaxID=2899127 RepID=UPI001EE95520|nr:hypothetical protein [Ectothiorhodospira lacustris]MCG5501504.1 hypothetical protein [Ectothiorhodospira lacustris]MCG5509677.1 hypothetical protein [Ectothiorhodospira lacustris]MCG5523090.1 hypothetical protein [Ectothiorhodospira lacustris]
MTPPAAHQPAIPMGVFRKLVATLTPEELARLPPDKLPENIPLDLVEDAPLYSRRTLESLILAANAYHLGRRLDLQDRYGDEVMAALDKSKVTGNTANVKIFHYKLEDLERLHSQWRADEEPIILERLGNGIRTLNALLLDVRAENSDTSMAAQLLRTRTVDAEHTETIQQAITELRTHSERIEGLLGRYFRLRLDIVRHEMHGKLQQISRLDQQAEVLREQIEHLRTELEQTQTLWRRTLKKNQTNHQADHLQSRISALVAEQRAREVSISENQLTLWLDALVDAALHPKTRQAMSGHQSDARVALYALLNRYCQQQEASAMQIARNPFLQVDPAQAIRFMLLSEQFILDYFSKKRNETTAWISDVAQVRSEDLDGLERMILGELKKSSRFRRRGG